jgi:hypothetical protein
MKKILIVGICVFLTNLAGWSQTQVGNSDSPIYYKEGNVGVGTSTPGTTLSINGTLSKVTTTGVDGRWDNLIKYGHKRDLESGSSLANRWHGIDATITAGDAASNKLKFRLYGGGTGNEEPVDVMTLYGNGNVGIGTTANPYCKLALKEDAQVLNFLVNKKLDGVWPPVEENATMTIQSSGSHVGNLAFATGNREVMRINSAYNVGIGTPYPKVKLDVAGTIRAYEIVVSKAGTADFVFDKDYLLRPLTEVEVFVREHKHLPEIPSAQEMEKEGVNVAEMNKFLLQKIEELTLYQIEMYKRLNRLEQEKIHKQER